MDATVRLTPYDEVVYPTLAFSQTHPGRLAAVAWLHGLETRPAGRSRVLELGCGNGGNLIPMAYAAPASHFVGIDLSPSAILKAQEAAEKLGLSNIELQHQDILDFVPDASGFDYIIAHGVYSWVPDEVRAKIWSILSEGLAPAGLGYLSYNCKPGAHLRDMARDIMLFHVGDHSDPLEKIGQARAILNFVAEAAPKENIYGFILKDQIERLRKTRDEVFFHDDLAPGSKAFLLHEVVREAESHGLQYLCEATFSDPKLRGHTEKVLNLLGGIPDEAFAAGEQILDFIECRSFRQTLFCRGGIPLKRRPDPATILKFFAASSVMIATDSDSGAVTFRKPDGKPASPESPLGHAVLARLAEVWPDAVHASDLLELGKDAASGGDPSAALAALLYEGFATDLIELSVEPPTLCARVSDYPQASLLARKQAAEGMLVTNLRHEAVLLKDELVRCFLQLLDGTRDRNRLLEDLRSRTTLWHPADAGPAPELTLEAIQDNLEVVAKLGLLL